MNNPNDVLANGVDAPRRKQFRMPGLSGQVFIALGLGLVAGIFFGELMTVIEPIDGIFIDLLQMAVWPYIVVSLIGGLGRLSKKQAASLGLSGGAFICYCAPCSGFSNFVLGGITAEPPFGWTFQTPCLSPCFRS